MAENLRINITAKNKTKSAFKSVGASVGGLKSKLGGLKGALIGAFAVAGIGALIKRTVDFGDELQKLSIRLGASTEALSQYKHVAELSGVSFNSFTNGLKRLQKSASDAAIGLSTPKRAFAELGIEVDKFVKLRPTEQFEILADALQGVENSATRTRIAMDLMGRAGVDLLSAMDGGSAGIRKMREEADKLGLTMTRVEADEMAAFNDALTRLKGAFAGLVQVIVVSIGPALTAIAIWFSEKLPVAINFAKKAWQNWINVFTEVLARVLGGFSKVSKVLAKMPDFLGGKKWEAWAKTLDKTALTARSLQKEINWAADATENFSDTVKKATPQLKDVFNPELQKIEKKAKKAKDAIKGTRGEAKKLSDVLGSDVKTGFEGVASAIENFARRGEFSLKSFKELALNVFGEVLSASLRTSRAFPTGGFPGTPPIISDSGDGGIFGGIKKLFGFAGGGSFKVGGAGGTDSQVVVFRASPDERVTVTRPGQSAGRAIIVNYNIDARGAEVGVEQRIEQVLARREPFLTAKAVNESLAQVEFLANQGGAFSKSIGRR